MFFICQIESRRARFHKILRCCIYILLEALPVFVGQTTNNGEQNKNSNSYLITALCFVEQATNSGEELTAQDGLHKATHQSCASGGSFHAA